MVSWFYLIAILVAPAALALGLISTGPFPWTRLRSLFPSRTDFWAAPSLGNASSYLTLLGIPLVAITTILATCAFSLGLFQPATGDINLPILVMGPDGTTESIQVNVSNSSNVDHLWIKAHSIGYPYDLADRRGYQVDKASIQLNGSGNWLSINNQTVTCEEPEESYRCVDGPMHTIQFRIPIEDLGSLQDGANTLSFRFNYAHPSGEMGDPSTGYRILGVELRNASGTDLIDGTTFQWDDPSTWTAPDGYTSSSDVSAGKSLWHARDRLVDGWNGKQIWASCADCHVKDGYDLQYFAFSNKSIVERSRFHGLSEAEGKQIAAYIRSIDIKTADGQTIAPPGRPWNPPYQPGPTASGTRAADAPRTNGLRMDDADPVYWAAGAGLDWVLETDDEMKAQLFPNGVTTTSYQVDAAPGTEGAINLREAPVALQMPDWNEWLPTVHPRDAYSSGYQSHSISSFYENEVPDLIQQARNGNLDKARKATALLWKHMREGVQGEVSFENGYCRSDNPEHGDWQSARLSCMQWVLTKSFEVMQPNHFEAQAKDLYGAAAEPRQWFSDARVVFDQAPHIVGHVKGDPSGIMDLYHDTAWYQLQLVLNPGSAIGTKIKPNDWRYHYMHLNVANQPAPHGWRYVASYLKMLQVADGIPESTYSDVPEGWWMRHTTPSYLDTQHGWAQAPLGALTSDEYRRVVNLAGKMMINGFTNESMDLWSRGTGTDGLDPESHTPQPIYGDIGQNVVYPDNFWTTLKNWGEAGAAYEILRPLASWAETAWPKGDWMGRIAPFEDNPSVDDQPSGQSPTIKLDQPSSSTFTAPATIQLEASASDPDGTVQQVQFFAAGSAVGSSSSAPYTTTWADVAAGTYTLKAVATDNDGATSTATTSVTVQPSGGARNGVAFKYYEGRWSQLPDFAAMSPVDEGTLSTFALSPAQQSNEFGFRFTTYVNIPESSSGSYTFYTESDDGSRLLVDGTEVVNNDGLHGLETASGAVDLSAGWHKIVVEYFDQEYEQALTVSWNGPTFSKEVIPSDRLWLTPDKTASQAITLSPGWNVISSRIMPSSPDLGSVFGSVSVILVTDEAGNAYKPAENQNEIGQWDSTAAYKVYTETKQTLSVEGKRVSESTVIPLERGWNLVPYLPQNAQTISSGLQSIHDEIVIVKNEAGQTYVPEYGVNEIGKLKPDEGYQIYVDAAVDLVYSDSASPATAVSDR